MLCKISGHGCFNLQSRRETRGASLSHHSPLPHLHVHCSRHFLSFPLWNQNSSQPKGSQLLFKHAPRSNRCRFSVKKSKDSVTWDTWWMGRLRRIELTGGSSLDIDSALSGGGAAKRMRGVRHAVEAELHAGTEMRELLTDGGTGDGHAPPARRPHVSQLRLGPADGLVGGHRGRRAPPSPHGAPSSASTRRDCSSSASASSIASSSSSSGNRLPSPKRHVCFNLKLDNTPLIPRIPTLSHRSMAILLQNGSVV